MKSITHWSFVRPILVLKGRIPQFNLRLVTGRGLDKLMNQAYDIAREHAERSGPTMPISSLATSRECSAAARRIGVLPYSSIASTAAPFSISRRITSAELFSAATSRGVLRSGVLRWDDSVKAAVLSFRRSWNPRYNNHLATPVFSK